MTFNYALTPRPCPEPELRDRANRAEQVQVLPARGSPRSAARWAKGAAQRARSLTDAGDHGGSHVGGLGQRYGGMANCEPATTRLVGRSPGDTSNAIRTDFGPPGSNCSRMADMALGHPP